VHDYAHSLWIIGGWREVIGNPIQGGWIGLAILLLGYFLPYTHRIRRSYRRFESEKRAFKRALKFKAFRVLQRVLPKRGTRRNPKKKKE